MVQTGDAPPAGTRALTVVLAVLLGLAAVGIVLVAVFLGMTLADL